MWPVGGPLGHGLAWCRRTDAAPRAEVRTMRRMRTWLPDFALILASLVLATVPVASVRAASDHVLRVNWGPPVPDTLDPQHSDEGQWSISGGLDYEGLTRIDADLQVIPGAAESWQFGPDGKTLTFHLRGGLVFSDGVPVTAEHFRYAAERICSPELDSRSVNLLIDVIGCEALFRSGTDAAAAAKARADFGVRALDDRTIEYRFTRPVPYFPAYAAVWGTIPLREELIEQGGPDWWKNPSTRIGNGPFKMAAYPTNGPDEHLVYERNDRYWGGQTKLDRLEFLFLNNDDPATMKAYRDGELEVLWPGGEGAFPALEADPVLSREMVTIPDAGMNYYNFNFNKAPFQDKKVREAFAYAFDREAYCEVLSYGDCTPALSMVPPGMPGAIETDAYAFDPVKARQALAESSYGGPEQLPEITWHGFRDDPESHLESEWLAEQFRQVLGVELNVVYLSEEDHDALYDSPATQPQFHGSIWFAGPDARDWFVIWRCDTTFNDRGFCDPALDALLDRADAELDPEQRLALYEEAGRMLVADCPAIFRSSAGMTWLVKSAVTGYTRTTGLDGDWPGWMNLMTVDVVRPA
jgi:oligopeptide transport system substrate-binding protein